MSSYVLEWLNLLVRWLHFTAGIAWIGTSFYFVWLDDTLTPPQKPEDVRRGVLGEVWSVHGGGFYHNQKYLTGPKGEPLTEHLHWFKWEAYATWLSGMAMLAIVYWIGAGTYLIDKSVMNLTPAAAIAISIATLAVGWFVYDALCRLFADRPLLLGGIVYVLLALAAWGLSHVFAAQAAYMHVGAIIGTIMVANVFFWIIPGQRKMLADIRAGREPDPRPGQLAKIRSVHNTYFTLPVLFIMISAHYPMTYDNRYGWLVLAVICLAGVLLRYFFVLSHKNKIVPALPIAAAVLLAAAAIAIAPHPRPLPAVASSVTFAQVRPVIAQRCAVCHSPVPVQPGFAAPPDGVLLDHSTLGRE
ncbi:MAG: urate hydroxylase PuuD, partial [Firmicutes bacterium]|nr:urate hydroxylase PuuD [Bacillota bacterium]